MVTHTPVGALPLSIITTSDETTDTLTSAFQMYVNCLDANSFSGNATDGPDVIMTDNCDEFRDAFHAVWPKCKLMLCIFHMMQQVWLVV